jgi:hypothetical protein
MTEENSKEMLDILKQMITHDEACCYESMRRMEMRLKYINGLAIKALGLIDCKE